MSTIATLIVEITANADKLNKGLAGAKARIATFAKSAAKALKNASLILAAGTVAGIAAVVAMVNKYSAEIDKLAKTSSKLGVTVSSLQKLQYQAELTGVSSDTMNMALQRMVRRSSEAAKGTGEAKDALKELGLDAKKLAMLSPDKQFYAISEAMKGVGSQGDKVRLAMKIFDTEGVSLVNTMNSNLEATSKEFDKIGISVTESGARMVEAYNDSKQKMGALFSGFGLKLTEQLAAPFKVLVDWVNESIIRMGGMESVAKSFAKFTVSSIKAVIGAVDAMYKAYGNVENIMLRIEKLKLTPKVLVEKAVKGLTGKEGTGWATKRTQEIESQIQSNNAGIANSDFVKGLDQLLIDIDKSVGAKIEGSIKPEYGKILSDATNNTLKLSQATEEATENIRGMSRSFGGKAGEEDSNIIGMNSFKLRAESNSMKSRIDAVAGSSLSSRNYRGLQGFSGDGDTANVKSMQQYIDESPAGKALQEMRKGKFGRNSGISLSDVWKGDSATFGGKSYAGESLDKLTREKPKTTITLEMVTDAGKIAGELAGDQEFINKMSRLQNSKVNEEARAAAL